MPETDADADKDPPVRLSLPLEYQQDVFYELREEDALLVIARGLGLLRLVTNLLHSYDAAGNNLILLVGANDRENGWIGEALAEQAAVSGSPKCRGLQLVNTDLMSVGTREKMYAGGGIFSITSRILIVDFLSGLLDPAIVTGMVALHADSIAATSLEAFIVRIFKQKNKKGFLKAFSDQPEPFTSGFQPLTTILRNLFLRKPILYPRFHVTVAKSLEGKRKAEVIELEVPMSDSMREIQNAVLECVEVSIAELKKGNSGIEVDDWNLDSALHRSFDTIIRRQLDPVWHRTSFRTKQIVRDLSLLRTILHSLLSFDAVSFNKYLDTVLAASSPPPGSTRQNQSPWLFLDAAHTLFNTAKRRVYTGKISEGSTGGDSNNGLNPVLEELPKWNLLAEILEEIERDVYFNPQPQDESNGSILIMCGDQGTCRQLREYLQTMHAGSSEETNGNEAEAEDDDLERKPSAKFMMRRKLRNYLYWKRDFARVSSNLFAENQKAINGTTSHGQNNRGRGPPGKRRRMRGGAGGGTGAQRTAGGSLTVAGDKDAHIQSLMNELAPTEVDDTAAAKADVGADPLDDMDDYYELYDTRDLVLVHPYDGDMDDHLLEEVKPRYVIMYEPDAAFIRRIEVYRSSHTSRQVRVYFMYYGGSVEEQRYLSAVRREKDAFTKLIRERGNMALTFTHDTPNLDPQESFLRTVNTRIAGGGRLAATAEPPRVVIDVREFRSSLPSLLHGRNMVTIPCMLTVGDYVLTPAICIERKSIKDLISSFNDGRLYHQAEVMFQHYKSPMLLIEFDAQKAFTLEPFADLSSAIGTASIVGSDLQSKLVLLCLAFPKLRIIWSSSPYQTAEIFEELKKQQDEPDPIKAVQIGLENGDDPESRTFNQIPQDMLRAVPGVTAKALARLIIQYENVQAVANTDEEELSQLVGRESARQIRSFFDRSVWDEGGARHPAGTSSRALGYPILATDLATFAALVSPPTSKASSKHNSRPERRSHGRSCVASADRHTANHSSFRSLNQHMSTLQALEMDWMATGMAPEDVSLTTKKRTRATQVPRPQTFKNRTENDQAIVWNYVIKSLKAKPVGSRKDAMALAEIKMNEKLTDREKHGGQTARNMYPDQYDKAQEVEKLKTKVTAWYYAEAARPSPARRDADRDDDECPPVKREHEEQPEVKSTKASGRNSGKKKGQKTQPKKVEEPEEPTIAVVCSRSYSIYNESPGLAIYRSRKAAAEAAAAVKEEEEDESASESGLQSKTGEDEEGVDDGDEEDEANEDADGGEAEDEDDDHEVKRPSQRGHKRQRRA